MPAVHSLFNGVKGWPTADLAKLLVLVHGEIHARAEHHRKAEAKRTKVSRKDTKHA